MGDLQAEELEDMQMFHTIQLNEESSPSEEQGGGGGRDAEAKLMVKTLDKVFQLAK